MSEDETEADTVRQNALRQAELAFGPAKPGADAAKPLSAQTLEVEAPPEGDVAAESKIVSAETDETATAPSVITGMADDETPDGAPPESALAAAELEEVETLEPETSRDPGPISAVAEETAGMSPAPLSADDETPSEESER